MSRLIVAETLHHVRDWYGCSGGAICAFFGALGVSASWIREAVEHFDTRAIANIEGPLVDDFFTCWGVNSGDKMIEFVGRFADTWEPGASTWTFADLAIKRPGITLNITATNVSRGCLTVFNTVNTPDIRILEAIRASSAVPCFFTPWIHMNGDMYSDGAILEYYPWQCVSEPSDTLVLVCSDTGISGRKITPIKIQSFGDYIRRLIKLVQQTQVKDPPKFWIATNNKSVAGLDFDMTREQRLQLFAEGVTVAEGWLKFRRRRRFTPPVFPAKTAEIHPSYEDQCASSSARCDQDRMSDNPQSRSRPLPTYPTRDSRSAEQHSARRWSL
jgi:predicted acylesterase/phospholipase RssA